jgi:hypothetical protein
MKELTRHQGNFLMFLETCCVDSGGKIDGIRMNAEELAWAKEWDAEGYIIFGRLLHEHVVGARCLGVRLSNDAWVDAHRLRYERAQRNLLDLKKLTGDRREPDPYMDQEAAAIAAGARTG